ncbi:hypothetical protein ACOAOW_07280 [Pseudomonas aeruginosa]|uniref:hypothetical protein n=1 Tax=Pseudomonas aeruginosa TaxID=287 RepID=UPI0003B991AA|nr:hypothetical protein [Pseudomonas aeruginosa]ERY75416.1 hypothetical protein Q029_02247 [Pseudomonas aeruginosa BWHPSA016]MCS9827564.1 hypothetical protein [Pseudomonas aeruginosa]
MSSTQHQLIKQCATRLRGIVEALDNIHDSTPHRWSTDLDDVHSSAESLLALIKDQAPTQAAQGLAGAALAQPSPASVCATPAGENCPGDGVKSCKKCPEQPEAERPEVVAWLVVAKYPHKEARRAIFMYEANADDQGAEWCCDDGVVTISPLIDRAFVAQAERIAGALRAELQSQRERNTELIFKLGSATNGWGRCEKERDAALARVEQQERTIAGMNEAHAKLADLYEAAQAQHSAGYAEARQCVNCRHIGINDAADYAACHDCRWTGPEPDEDKCPGCAGENCMAAACPECGGRYELVAEAKISTPAAQAGQMPQAWLDVQAERRRQITAEGWTPEHDDEHSHGQMARAAACYALAGSSAPNDGTAALLVSLAWPWDQQWWKPTSARRDLIKAGALILAEIERLDRAAPGKEVGHE